MFGIFVQKIQNYRTFNSLNLNTDGILQARTSFSSDFGSRCPRFSGHYPGLRVIPSNCFGAVFSSKDVGGRLEFFDSDRGWGTVCNDCFQRDCEQDNKGDQNVRVICRQLGYDPDSAVYRTIEPNTDCESDSRPILIDDLRCEGSEGNILNCTHQNIGHHNCIHIEDIGIGCDHFRLPVICFAHSQNLYWSCDDRMIVMVSTSELSSELSEPTEVRGSDELSTISSPVRLDGNLWIANNNEDNLVVFSLNQENITVLETHPNPLGSNAVVTGKHPDRNRLYFIPANAPGNIISANFSSTGDQLSIQNVYEHLQTENALAIAVSFDGLVAVLDQGGTRLKLYEDSSENAKNMNTTENPENSAKSASMKITTVVLMALFSRWGL